MCKLALKCVEAGDYYCSVGSAGWHRRVTPGRLGPQNKPILSVYPSSSVIKTQGHSRTHCTIVKTDFYCNHSFLKIRIKCPLKVFRTHITWPPPPPNRLIHHCNLRQPRTVFANAVGQHSWIPRSLKKTTKPHHKSWGAPQVRAGLAGWGRSPGIWGRDHGFRSLSAEHFSQV